MGEILYYFVALDGGVFNEIIGIFGIEPVYWMHSGLSSTIMIILINSWQYMGLCMIIYLAGLQNIPSMYIEAAKLDGASKHQMFWHVTFPLLIPAVTTAVVTNLIGGFKLFDPIVPLSNGGPNRQSMSLAFYINLLYFNDEKAGVASALGIVTFLVIMAISIPVNKFLQSREVEY
jgi:raffinose/stachyose/melibiose transport system permease protein